MKDFCFEALIPMTICVVAVLLSSSSVSAGESPEADSDQMKYDAVFAFHEDMLKETEMKDAKTAIEYWIKVLAGYVGYRMKGIIYNNLDSLIMDAKKGAIDLISVSPHHYPRITSTLESSLGYMPLMGGKKTRKYFLLVRSDSQFSSINDLKGKKLAALQANEIALIYLNTLLLKNAQEEANKYFSQVIEMRKFSQAILAVFFGQVDACVAPEFAFNAVAEMNPQVGKCLKAIAVSPEFVHLVSCFRKGFDEDLKKHPLDVLFHMEKYPEGKQLMMLLRIEGTAPAFESDLTTIKILLDEYEQLKKKAAH